ncbi:hypothetical protein F5Y18DRAFT_140924 [Xylariaceae sp. FL1019]|nr:hypothetical protein F5Y18DRAFT_140924 [Xylariaceae sp. FL1019]
MSFGFSGAQPAISSPPRPHHQLRRSITEESPPSRHSRVHQFLPRTDRHRDDRFHAQISSPARNSLDFARLRIAATKSIDEASKTAYMASSVGDDNTSNTIEPRAHPPPLSAEEKQTQKRNNEATAACIRKSILDLQTFSSSTILRLDESYTSVLQRLSSLQSTIVSWKELAAVAQEINDGFVSESQTLVGEITSQLSVYDHSDEQRKRIQALQARISTGRDKIQTLSKRVDVVRERIESWEKADKAWQERTRRRLKVLWIIVLVIALAIMFMFAGIQYAGSPVDLNTLKESITVSQHSSTPDMDDILGNKSKSAAAMTDELRQVLARRRDQGAEAIDNEPLRRLDEL